MKIRQATNFGFSGVDNGAHLGTNGKMTEICAAMGITNLQSLSATLVQYHANYQSYQSLLGDVDGITLSDYGDLKYTNCQYIVVEVKELDFGMSRDQLWQILINNEVIARRYFFPGCHKMEPYRSDRLNDVEVPITDSLCDTVLCLPTGTAVDQKDIERVCSIIRNARTGTNH